MAEPSIGFINPGDGGSDISSGIYTAHITANEFVENFINSSKDIKFILKKIINNSDESSTSRQIYSVDGFSELDHPDHTIIIVSTHCPTALPPMVKLYGIDDEYLNSDQDAFDDRRIELGI